MANKQASTKQTPKPRALAKPDYRPFRLQKRIKHSKAPLPSGFKLFRTSLLHLKKNWKVFLGITIVLFVLTLLLVRGLASTTDIESLKDEVQDALSDGGSGLLTSFALFGVLLGNVNTSSSDIGTTYQTITLVLSSLAIIWALRQTYAKTSITTKEAYYKGMYPLVPFLLVLIVVGLQLLPFAIGAGLFNTVIANEIAITGLEKFLWGALLFLLTTLSLYMISSSIFALYIVTLPDMKPMQALRSARELVRYRRWSVLRKLLLLPILLLLLSAVIVIPFIVFVPVIAEWVFFVVSMFALVISHTYIYTIYRELL